MSSLLQKASIIVQNEPTRDNSEIMYIFGRPFGSYDFFRAGIVDNFESM